MEELSIYQTKLDNGLKLYIYSNTNIKKQYAQVMVNCGSNDTIKYCPGIAHYLEHTKFANESGDWFNIFNKYGANANAYTNYQQTAYYFTCANNFINNLDTLINMVMQPYFTQEVVDKERNIIAQEINMYDQMPEWKMNNIILQNISQNNYGIDIAGTIADINRITPAMLQEVYDLFYVTDNMSLSICTSHSVDEIIKYVEEVFNKYNQRGQSNHNYVQETSKVNVHEEIIINNDVNSSLWSYIYKFNFPVNKIDTLITLEIVKYACFSNCNQKFFDLLQTKLINDTFSIEPMLSNDLCVLWCDMQSDDINLVSKLDALWNLHEEDFEVARNLLLGKTIKKNNDKCNVMEQIQTMAANGIDLLEYQKRIQTITYDEVKVIFDDLNASKQTSIVVMKNDII